MNNVSSVITLADSELEVFNNQHGGYWSKFQASVTMRLSPVPRVFIEATSSVASSLMDYGQTVKVRFPDGPEFEANVVQIRFGPSLGSRLVPSRQPVTVFESQNKHQCVEFKVINYPGLSDRARPALLNSGPWAIELRALPDLQESRKTLSSESGYAMTHEGSIRRSDGKSFSVGEAEIILSALHLLLSFARGGSCGLTLITGTDKRGERTWEQWGSYPAFPWFSLTSWMDHRHNGDKELAEAWPGFLEACRNPANSSNDWFRVALYWYLRSNEANNPYVGIVLTQAALERLAREVSNGSGRKSRDTKATIRAAVEQVGVDAAIPECCRHLHGARRHDSDGPTTLVRIRNDLIHPKTVDGIDLNGHLQARDLGQWYVELFLLWLIAYRGSYANRISYAYEGKWAPEMVPWSRRPVRP